MIQPQVAEFSRTEHLKWCKERALAYVEAGDLDQAFASMASDLGKHDSTARHTALLLGIGMIAGGHLSTPGEMKRFIEGFA